MRKRSSPEADNGHGGCIHLCDRSQRSAAPKGNRVTYSFDIRRLGLMALTLLIALAVIGPSCLIFASHAVAMPSHAPKGCESSGKSMGVCPHKGETKVKVVAPQQALAVPALPASTISVPQVTVAFAQTEQPPGAPVAHLTPLRI